MCAHKDFHTNTHKHFTLQSPKQHLNGRTDKHILVHPLMRMLLGGKKVKITESYNKQAYLRHHIEWQQPTRKGPGRMSGCLLSGA